MQELCRLLDLQKTRTTSYHPQGNGGVERFNRTLKLKLLAHSDQQRDDWDETLPLCLFAYRTSVHATTGFTPDAAVYGRELRVPLDFELEASQDPDLAISEFVEKLSTDLW